MTRTVAEKLQIKPGTEVLFRQSRRHQPRHHLGPRAGVRLDTQRHISLDDEWSSLRAKRV